MFFLWRLSANDKFWRAEVKNTRILPKGIFIGIIIVVLLYLLINYSYTEVIGYDKMKTPAPSARFYVKPGLARQAEKFLMH